MEVGNIVIFVNKKNSRGYPLTGRLLEIRGEKCDVASYGLYGPGTSTLVTDVPLSELKDDPSDTEYLED